MHGEDSILCSIEDNGIGREAAERFKEKDPKFKAHKSMGTRVTENRLLLLNPDVKDEIVQTIDLRDEKTGFASGTKVLVQIPVVEVQIK